MASKVKWLAKFIFVGALLYFLGRRGFLSLEATGRAFSQYPLMLCAFVLMGVSTLLGILRWRTLLVAQGIRLSFTRIVQLAFVGNFFNIALPGAVSGDLVKAIYVSREVEGARAKGFGSILFDRVTGVSALVLVSASALLFGYERFNGTALMKGIQFFVVMAAAFVVVFYGYLFLVRDQHDPLLRLLELSASRLSRMGSVLRIYQGIKIYQLKPRAVLSALLASIGIHLIVCTCCVLYLQALSVGDIPPEAVFVIVPLGLLVTAVPVMPAGVGTGHAAFLWLFGFLGTDRGADVFSLVAFFNVAYGMVGGLVYLRFRSRDPRLQLTPELQ